MNKKLGLTTVIVLVLFLLSACSRGDVIDENQNQEENVDAVATASIVKEEEAFKNAISSNGEWIIATLNDLTFEEEIVVEGTFYDGGDSANDTYRKIAAYAQDESRTVTDRYTITAPQMIIKSPNTRFQAGVFAGDIIVEAEGFTLYNATVEGNIYFASNEYQESAEITEDSEVTGEIQVSYNDNELKEYVSDFVKREFGSGYKPSDIFVYKNSPYYVSVMEVDTGRGAFEILFDPNTKEFQPEPGPNMMWNEKYGMMDGMMGGNMMGLNQIPENDYNTNQVSRDEALNYASEYLDRNQENIEVSDEGHEFYGYYTLHTEKDNKPYGMLSVNSRTGEVWYHDWHGELEKIIEIGEHEDDENH